MPNELYFDEPSNEAVLRLKEIFNQHKLPLILSLGTILVLGGIFITSQNPLGGAKVEIIDNNTLGVATSQIASDSAQKIIVEISGQVNKPGVYELLASERVDRLLVEAGGLAAQADRSWVEKNINRAAKLVDGQKLYIPKKGEVTAASSQNMSIGIGNVAGAQSEIVNINTASLKELDKLTGIGEVRAQAIIDGRPYGSIDELHTRKVIPKSVFEKIKGEIGI